MSPFGRKQRASAGEGLCGLCLAIFKKEQSCFFLQAVNKPAAKFCFQTTPSSTEVAATGVSDGLFNSVNQNVFICSITEQLFAGFWSVS